MVDDHGPGFDRAHGIWQRGGADIEILPDPFGPNGRHPDAATPPKPVGKYRRWLRWGFNVFAALLLVTLIWLVISTLGVPASVVVPLEAAMPS